MGLRLQAQQAPAQARALPHACAAQPAPCSLHRGPVPGVRPATNTRLPPRASSNSIPSGRSSVATTSWLGAGSTCNRGQVGSEAVGSAAAARSRQGRRHHCRPLWRWLGIAPPPALALLKT